MADAERPAGTVTRDRRSRVRRLLRYLWVNLAGLAVDYAVFIPLAYSTGAPVLSSIPAYIAAFALNYALSRRFVFGTDGAHKGERRLAAEFMATGLLGVTLTAAVTGIGAYGLGLGPVTAKTIAVIVAFVTLYIVRSRLVFTPHPEDARR